MSTPRIMTEPEDVSHWLVHGKPGSRIVYYTGFLGPDLYVPRPSRGPEQSAIAGAWILYEAAKQRRVHLVQRRIAKGKFEYIAEKRPAERERFGWTFNPTRVAGPQRFRGAYSRGEL